MSEPIEVRCQFCGTWTRDLPDHLRERCPEKGTPTAKQAITVAEIRDTAVAVSDLIDKASALLDKLRKL